MNLNKSRIIGNPFIAFAPFFILYIIIGFAEISHINDGDSLRYQFYAKNLISGYFSSSEIVDIWNGPMYPIFLTPIYLLNLPVWFGLILHALFMYLSGVFLCKSVMLFASKRIAFLSALIFLCVPNFHILIRSLISEPLACMFVSLTLYYSILAFNKRKYRYVFAAGLMCAGLILTKVIFSYAFVVVGVMFLFLALWRRTALTGVYIVLVSFLFCSPWLAYTYSKTGKMFYWSSSGGENLYLLALPYDNFKVSFKRCKNSIDFNWDYVVRPYVKNPNYESYFPDDVKNDAIVADSLSMVDSCDYLTKRAREMIMHNPVAYATNVLTNIKYLFYAPPFLRPSALICFICLFPFAIASIAALFLVAIKKIPIDMGVLFPVSLVIIYLLGSILLIAMWRQFYVVLPVLIFWISYVFNALYGQNSGGVKVR